MIQQFENAGLIINNKFNGIPSGSAILLKSILRKGNRLLQFLI